MSHPENEKWLEDRQQWLEERDAKDIDVESDENGEYVVTEDGNVYLPTALQTGAEPTVDEDDSYE